jgi:hypothetical protein
MTKTDEPAAAKPAPTMEELRQRLQAPFPEAEIEWRVQQSGFGNDGKPWVMVLAYVDARAVQSRLDDVFGVAGWQTVYQECKGGMLCGLSAKVGGEWVTKFDGSPETDIEAFKGGLSKALVRVASAGWGIGRYLYKLEANFAQVFDKRGDGLSYAKVSDKYKKRQDAHVYWAAPKLPAWALPGSKEAPPAHATAPAAAAPVAPVQPNGAKSAAKKPPAEAGTKPAADDAKKGDPKKPVTQPQLKRLFAIASQRDWPKDEVNKLVSVVFAKESANELNMGQYDWAVDKIEKYTPEEFGVEWVKLQAKKATKGAQPAPAQREPGEDND